VAHYFPTKLLLGFEKFRGISFPRAVVMASDSLFVDTTSQGSKVRLGKKVFPLTPNVVAVTSGDYYYAREALIECKRRLNAAKSFSWEELGQMAQDSFLGIRTYSIYLERDILMECLIGARCDKSNEAIIIKLSCATRERFQPTYSTSYELIGGEVDAEDEMKRTYKRFIDDQTRLSTGRGDRILHECTRVMEALDSTIKEGHSGIGGPVQVLAVREGGFKTVTGFIINPNDIENPTIERTTPEEDQIKEIKP